MTVKSFTPGPWTRVPQSSGGDLIAHEYETGNQMNPKGLRLVAFMMARGNSLRQDEANARLTAAAPDLFEALSNWLDAEDAYQGDPADDERLRSCRTAAREARSRALGGERT